MSKTKDIAIKTAQNPAAYPEVIKVSKNTDQVACNGGHPTLGHPMTYYTFGDQDYIECGYCDRRFVRSAK
jgi:uncharacterized Zn-finger protein